MKPVARLVAPFAEWLTARVPVTHRIPVYVSPRESLVIDGGEASASFFEPAERPHAPYVRLAGGELRRLVRLGGKRLAVTTYMRSLAHEVVHYEQWRAGRAFTERGVVNRADRYVREYLVHAGLQYWSRDLVSRAGSLHDARRYSDAFDIAWVARRISVRCLCADFAVANSAHMLGGDRSAARLLESAVKRPLTWWNECCGDRDEIRSCVNDATWLLALTSAYAGSGWRRVMQLHRAFQRGLRSGLPTIFAGEHAPDLRWLRGVVMRVAKQNDDHLGIH